MNHLPHEQIWILNTSHPGKLEEFQRLFAKHGRKIRAQKIGLREIQADPITVVVHKASQVASGVLV